MFVCSCRVVSDQSIRGVIAEGAETVEQITDRCGAGGRCGSCRPALQRILETANGQPVGARLSALRTRPRFTTRLARRAG